MSWTTQRARVAALSRSRSTTDPTLLQAKDELRRERNAALAELYISKLVAEAPQLTSEQRERLALLLASSTPHAGGAAA